MEIMKLKHIVHTGAFLKARTPTANMTNERTEGKKRTHTEIGLEKMKQQFQAKKVFCKLNPY